MRYQGLILAVSNCENVSARGQILKISCDIGSEESMLTITVGISSFHTNHRPHKSLKKVNFVTFEVLTVVSLKTQVFLCCLTLKMKAEWSFTTSGIKPIMQCYIAEDWDLQN
jgi:hypothetical protein